MKTRNEEYTVKVGSIDEVSWYQHLENFRDANLYQTPAYDSVRCREKDIIRFLLLRQSRVIAMAQARILSIPLTGFGIAYIFWGPLWRLKRENYDLDVFRMAIRALRREFSIKRKLLLRLNLLSLHDDPNTIGEILISEAFKKRKYQRLRRTLIMDISQPLTSTRAALDQKWRNCLNRSEKNNLEIIHGHDINLLNEISDMYSEMASRKNLRERANLEHLKKMQSFLPDHLKLQIIVCRQSGRNCAGAVFSAIGDTGIYLLGATSLIGMKSKGSYLIQWTFIQWLKESGFHYYDLNGINPEANPGTYHFKRGLAGKLGKDVRSIGQYEICESSKYYALINWGEYLATGFYTLLKHIRPGS